jgi:cysteine desulfurase family protein (TIGR01976 family)
MSDKPTLSEPTFSEPTFDVEAVRARYPALADDRVWLDGAAGSQVPDVVIDAVSGVYRRGLGNQGAAFAVSTRLGELVGAARTAVADLVGAPDPTGVVFGPSMTALAYRFASALARQWRPGDEVVVTELDHEANVSPWVQAARATGAVVRTAPLDRLSGTLAAEAVTRLLTDRTRLVAVTAASNLLGSMPDIPAIAAGARRAGALSFVDGVHHCPHAVVDVEALGVDLYLTSAYKWYGPHLAAAVARPGLLAELDVDNLAGVSTDGPARFELGTNPFPALAGVVAAVEHLTDPTSDCTASSEQGFVRREKLVAARTAATAHERALGTAMVDGLRTIDGVELLPGWDAARRTATATFRVRGAAPARVAAALDRAGVNVWHGNGYARRAASALGVLDTGGAVRASVNHYNRADDVERLLRAVADFACEGLPEG